MNNADAMKKLIQENIDAGYGVNEDEFKDARFLGNGNILCVTQDADDEYLVCVWVVAENTKSKDFGGWTGNVTEFTNLNDAINFFNEYEN